MSVIGGYIEGLNMRFKWGKIYRNKDGETDFKLDGRSKPGKIVNKTKKTLGFFGRTLGFFGKTISFILLCIYLPIKYTFLLYKFLLTNLIAGIKFLLIKLIAGIKLLVPHVKVAIQKIWSKLRNND